MHMGQSKNVLHSVGIRMLPSGRAMEREVQHAQRSRQGRKSFDWVTIVVTPTITRAQTKNPST